MPIHSPLRILLQTTIPPIEDDWNIERFSLLRQYLNGLQDESGNPLCQVTARDRHADANGNDPVISQLHRDQFDQLWLLALDVGDGLGPADCQGILRFHQQGGGIFTTRDHQDMGISMSALNPLSQFHYFNTRNRDPDESRCCIDDNITTYISFPNYHSGNNGDYQIITPIEPIHELLRKSEGVIQFFPAHPHEGGVGVPAGNAQARAIATGTSKITHRSFNLAVVDDPRSLGGENPAGRIVAQSTFHHLADYNWDIRLGCPTFVDEPPGQGYQREPEKLDDMKAYVRNLVTWLAPL